MVLRRLRSILLVIVLLPLLAITAPLWVPVTAALDLLRGRPRLPTTRIGLMGTVYLAHQWYGMAVVAWLTVTGRRRAALPHRRLQRRWITSIVRAGGPLLGVDFDMRAPELPAGRVIVLSRHASMIDAIVPVLLVEDLAGRPIHYALKAELQHDPCLDIVGHRLDNWFVQRGSDTERETAGMAAMAERTEADGAVAIFPEGTYATERSRAKVRASLERDGPPEAAALADELRHLLPPKPAGVQALLDAAPDADVMFLGHVGLEGVAEATGLLRTLPLRAPIVVDGWVVPRDEIPTDPDEVVTWLHDQWRRLDRWVGQTKETRA